MQYVPVMTTDRSSGRIHVRVQEQDDDGTVRRTLADERCQTDQSGAYDTAPFDGDVGETLRRLRESNGRANVCKFCLPEG